MAGKNNFGYAGIGIAMETLIESAVRVTITHSDSEPIASEAATAGASREEATGAVRPSKPAAPDDRIMGRNPLNARANHPPRPPDFAGIAGNIGAAAASKMAKWRRFQLLRPRRRGGPDPGLRHRAANPWRRSRKSARPAATRPGSQGRSRDRNRSGRRHGC